MFLSFLSCVKEKEGKKLPYHSPIHLLIMMLDMYHAHPHTL